MMKHRKIDGSFRDEMDPPFETVDEPTLVDVLLEDDVGVTFGVKTDVAQS